MEFCQSIQWVPSSETKRSPKTGTDEPWQVDQRSLEILQVPSWIFIPKSFLGPTTLTAFMFPITLPPYDHSFDYGDINFLTCPQDCSLYDNLAGDNLPAVLLNTTGILKQNVDTLLVQIFNFFQPGCPFIAPSGPAGVQIVSLCRLASLLLITMTIDRQISGLKSLGVTVSVISFIHSLVLTTGYFLFEFSH